MIFRVSCVHILAIACIELACGRYQHKKIDEDNYSYVIEDLQNAPGENNDAAGFEEEQQRVQEERSPKTFDPDPNKAIADILAESRCQDSGRCEMRMIRRKYDWNSPKVKDPTSIRILLLDGGLWLSQVGLYSSKIVGSFIQNEKGFVSNGLKLEFPSPLLDFVQLYQNSKLQPGDLRFTSYSREIKEVFAKWFKGRINSEMSKSDSGLHGLPNVSSLIGFIPQAEIVNVEVDLNFDKLISSYCQDNSGLTRIFKEMEKRSKAIRSLSQLWEVDATYLAAGIDHVYVEELYAKNCQRDPTANETRSITGGFNSHYLTNIASQQRPLFQSATNHSFTRDSHKFSINRSDCSSFPGRIRVGFWLDETTPSTLNWLEYSKVNPCVDLAVNARAEGESAGESDDYKSFGTSIFGFEFAPNLVAGTSWTGPLGIAAVLKNAMHLRKQDRNWIWNSWIQVKSSNQRMIDVICEEAHLNENKHYLNRKEYRSCI